MAVNLKAPAALGMRTIWIEHDHDWARAGSEQDYVHYQSADIKSCLRDILGRILKDKSERHYGTYSLTNAY